MATTAIVEVTPRTAIDPDRFLAPPDEIVAVLRGAGRSGQCGLSRRGQDPWRLCIEVTGPDRVGQAQSLATTFQRLGYEAEAHFAP